MEKLRLLPHSPMTSPNCSSYAFFHHRRNCSGEPHVLVELPTMLANVRGHIPLTSPNLQSILWVQQRQLYPVEGSLSTMVLPIFCLVRKPCCSSGCFASKISGGFVDQRFDINQFYFCNASITIQEISFAMVLVTGKHLTYPLVSTKARAESRLLDLTSSSSRWRRTEAAAGLVLNTSNHVAVTKEAQPPFFLRFGVHHISKQSCFQPCASLKEHHCKHLRRITFNFEKFVRRIVGPPPGTKSSAQWHDMLHESGFAHKLPIRCA